MTGEPVDEAAVLAALDFDASCEWQVVKSGASLCDAPARWVARSACCGHGAVACDVHRGMQEAALMTHRWVCDRCGRPLRLVFERYGGGGRG